MVRSLRQMPEVKAERIKYITAPIYTWRYFTKLEMEEEEESQ